MTVLPKRAMRKSHCFRYGPGNMMIDEAVRTFSMGRSMDKAFDSMLDKERYRNHMKS